MGDPSGETSVSWVWWAQRQNWMETGQPPLIVLVDLKVLREGMNITYDEGNILS